MRRKNKNLFLIILLSALLLIAIAGTVYLFASLSSKNKAYTVLKQESDDNISDLNNEVVEAAEKIEMLNNDILSLKNKIAAIEEEKTELIASYEKNDEKYRELNTLLEKKQAEIDKLESNIKKLESVYSVDINAQFDILSQLNTLLENIPQIETVTEVANDDGTIGEVITKRTPTIAVYYEDINNGYKYGYNETVIYDSASLIKLPFILSVLEKATANPDAYNFDEKITYTKVMYQTGSGKIKDEPEGTEYTYLQLIEYMLKYSDNVAFYQLKEKYGYNDFKNLVYNLGTRSLQKSLSNMTGIDGAKIMREVYKFIESDSPYAQFMYDCMVNSAHSVMISYAVSPKKVAHKYGWDTMTYHDMGIVYDDNPYILVILSDMEEGGDTVNEYIQSVVKLIAKLHTNFYSKA